MNRFSVMLALYTTTWSELAMQKSLQKSSQTKGLPFVVVKNILTFKRGGAK